jgi:hypothetical protein
VPGATGSDTNINATAIDTNATYYPVFVSTTGSSVAANADTGLTYNPSTNTLTTTNFTGTASTALYADLAERYLADAEYLPGTLLEFGGDQEVTRTVLSHSVRVAGVVSSDPAYLMNSGLEGTFVTSVALTGRVPCYVVGNIKKGDRLVSSDIPGVATALDINKYQPGSIVGKALEDYNSEDVGVISAVVGRL